MTRFFLAPMALLSIALFGASAHAETPVAAPKNPPAPIITTPQLKISGQTSFNVWFFQNEQKYVRNAKDEPFERKKFGRGQLFSVNDSRLRFTVDGKIESGLEYGLVMVLDGEVGAEKTVRENYLFFGGNWGKVYAGNTYGVQSTMAFGGWDNWGGTGFIEGANFDTVINYTTGAFHSVNLVGDTNRDTKFSYLTPRWNGLQAGATYTPRTEHRGETKINSITSGEKPKKVFDTDNISGGLNFIHKFSNGFEMALSATGIMGKARPEYQGAPKRRNVASYALGGAFSYSDVGFSFEYGDNGRSHEIGGQKFSNAGKFLDFGLSYTMGATKISAGYYYAWRNALDGTVVKPNAADRSFDTVDANTYKRAKSKTKAISVAVDHKLAPGLGVYFEYANFQMKNPAAEAEATILNQALKDSKQFTGVTKSNRANAFVIGSRLVF